MSHMTKQPTTPNTPSAAASFVADGSYPAQVIAASLTLATDAVPAWELIFLLRDHSTGQQFVFPLTLRLDARHSGYVAGIIETLHPEAQRGPLPYDPVSWGLVGRRCLVVIANDRPIGIDRLSDGPQAADA